MSRWQDRYLPGRWGHSIREHNDSTLDGLFVQDAYQSRQQNIIADQKCNEMMTVNSIYSLSHGFHTDVFLLCKEDKDLVCWIAPGIGEEIQLGAAVSTS